jgi:2-keto-4-pentenoate hydratase
MTPMEAADRERAATALARAEQQRSPIPPLIETWPAMTVEDAYEVQMLNVRRRVEAGAAVRGHKVGLTSAAMQAMLGVAEPDCGHLFDDMFVVEGDRVPIASYCAPRVEPEVAFVLGAPLAGPGCSAADVLRATAFVVPALEIIDSRISEWRIALADTVADNASSAAVVIGGRGTRATDVDLRLLGVVLRRNGEIVETGATGAALGNPVTAVAWLVNKLFTFGAALEEGQVVLPGSCTRAVDVSAGDHVRADFDVLGHVSVSFG